MRVNAGHFPIDPTSGVRLSSKIWHRRSGQQQSAPALALPEKPGPPVRALGLALLDMYKPVVPQQIPQDSFVLPSIMFGSTTS